MTLELSLDFFLPDETLKPVFAPANDRPWLVETIVMMFYIIYPIAYVIIGIIHCFGIPITANKVCIFDILNHFCKPVID